MCVRKENLKPHTKRRGSRVVWFKDGFCHRNTIFCENIALHSARCFSSNDTFAAIKVTFFVHCACDHWFCLKSPDISLLGANAYHLTSKSERALSQPLANQKTTFHGLKSFFNPFCFEKRSRISYKNGEPTKSQNQPWPRQRSLEARTT